MTEPRPTRIFLIRHGETEWNQNNPGYCGWTDISLNAKGMAQARAAANRLRNEPLAAVLCSDLVRARAMAEVIADAAGAPVFADSRFREMNYGEWEGWSPERLQQEDEERYRAWRADPEHVPPPGGETLQQVLERADPALEEWAGCYPGQDVALVSHKTTIRVLLCRVLGIPPRSYSRILQQNAALNVIEFRGADRLIGLINDTCHLPGDLCSPAV